MSKTVKILLIVAAVLIIGGVCACLVMTGGIATLAMFGSTSTPTLSPMDAVFTLVPTAQPATAVPLEPDTPAPEAPPSDTSLLPPQEEFTLDGVPLKIYSVRYSLINGGEGGANFLYEGGDSFLYIVTLDSRTMDLQFVSDNYFDTVRLVDLASGESYETDWMNWSLDDSPTNGGYVKISFPVQKVPQKPAIYFTDDLGIDLSPVIPNSTEVENPWLETKEKIDVGGILMRVQSAFLTSNYTALDGVKFQKDKSADKIMVVRLTANAIDLSGLDTWDPVLMNPDDLEDPYYYGYFSWVSDDNAGESSIEISYEVPVDLDEFILYLPYDNVMDLTPIMQKK